MSILGRPNAGKSTLLNALVGGKIAIVSDKPQTTRAGLQAVLTLPDAQVVFVDTPGVHESALLLHRKMMDAVREALRGRDLILWVAGVDEADETDLAAAAIVKDQRAQVYLVLNKIDTRRNKAALLPIIERYHESGAFAEVFPVSALTGEGVAGLTAAIAAALPVGPRYFPEDHLTDQPEKFLASEFVREAVLELTRQEVPHAVAVLVDQWEESRKLTRIAATVYVERDGQKRIVVGAGGSMLREIGMRARIRIEELLGRKVYLELFVKVRRNWRESPEFLNELDWRYMTGGNPE